MGQLVVMTHVDGGDGLGGAGIDAEAANAAALVVDHEAVEDSRFGILRLNTWALRLQVQIDRDVSADSDLFELDFDHTFKDRGQREVLSRMLLELDAEGGSSPPQS